MIRVTWEWLGQGPALDLANTVTIVEGVESDLLEESTDYDRWARSETEFLPEGSLRLLQQGRPELMELRKTVRELLAAITAGERPPPGVVKELNRVSRRAPQWLELDPDSLSVRERPLGRALEKLLAHFARSAMELIAGQQSQVRRCPAPSCGMFYVRTRASQHWCSTQCGTRARVARHYKSHRRTRVS